ncbi:hypothetical protein PsorP6_003262 [Peronosclerospora sorghi]|uniref:Uncharacterized protein n=1 Tax=Peronosclerospora sorghi TaxID=230839 RepID=A0ACC0VKP3_9STRA|nr:hypothetical protein PsorP6_003262 [Peronosclerospora sorghi]
MAAVIKDKRYRNYKALCTVRDDQAVSKNSRRSASYDHIFRLLAVEPASRYLVSDDSLLEEPKKEGITQCCRPSTRSAVVNFGIGGVEQVSIGERENLIWPKMMRFSPNSWYLVEKMKAKTGRRISPWS